MYPQLTIIRDGEACLCGVAIADSRGGLGKIAELYIIQIYVRRRRLCESTITL
jgi:hypothetical protein